MNLPVGILALAASAAVLFVGGALQGVAGFGMGLIALPVLLRVLPAETVVPLMTALAWVMNVQIFFKLWRNADLRVIAVFLLGACVGTQLGVYIPSLVPPRIFQIAVGLLICLSGLAIWKGWRVSLRGLLPRFAVGALSGALGASISLSGPPIAIFMTAGGVPKNTFRSSTALYFLLLNTVTLFTFGAHGALDARFVRLLVWLLPSLVLGTACGVCLGTRVPEEKFRAVVIVLIFVSGLSLLL